MISLWRTIGWASFEVHQREIRQPLGDRLHNAEIDDPHLRAAVLDAHVQLHPRTPSRGAMVSTVSIQGLKVLDETRHAAEPSAPSDATHWSTRALARTCGLSQ